MRYMVLVKATPESESGAMPSTEDFEAMNSYNQELARAGVLLAGEGLRPTTAGATRITLSGGKRTIIDGPFTETKELVAGFWILDVKSKEEAVEWVRRAPMKEGELEIRRVFEAEDFGDALPEHVREWEAVQRAEQEARRS